MNKVWGAHSEAGSFYWEEAIQSFDVTRRRALLGMAGLTATGATSALGVSTAARAMDIRQLSPLAFQAHTMRTHLIRDFGGTMRTMRAMGYEAVELASFPGFVGSGRGDFGALAQLTPAQIRRTIAEAGLRCTSAHFFPAELTQAALGRSAEWAKGVGLTHIVQAGIEVPARATPDQIRQALDLMNETGARVRAAGLQLGFHTDANVWRTIDGVDMTAEMMRRLEPQNVGIQMDFGTVVQAGADGAAIINRYPTRIWSIHLRDAKKPADTYAYLPATPLGTGEVDWAAVLRAGRQAGVKSYIVEMTRAPYGVFDAMKESYDYLRALQI